MATTTSVSAGVKLERSLARHPVFGDSQAILGRRLGLYEFALEILAERLPAIADPVQSILDLPAERRARFLDDPIVRIHIHEALGRLERGALGSPDHLETMFGVLAQGLTTDLSQSPLEARMSRRITLGADACWVWSPPEGDDAIVDNFKTRFSYEFLEHHSRTRSSRQGGLVDHPDDRLVRLLRDGYELLFELTPELGRSVLDHVRAISFMRVETEDAAVQSGSVRAIPGSIFLSPRHLQTPWAIAEALLHEAAHNKLFDLYLVRLVLEPDYDCTEARRIVAPWNRPTMMQDNAWPLDQALSAFHVYLHLSIMGLAVDAKAEALSERFGELDRSGAMKCTVAAERAEYLGMELQTENDAGLGPDGQRLVDWLVDELAKKRGASHLRVPETA